MRLPAFLRRAARRFLGDESGATTAEYAVLAAFLMLVCVAAVAAFKVPAGSAIEASGTSVGTYADPGATGS